MLGNTRQYLYSSIKLPMAQTWLAQRLEDGAATLAQKLDPDSIGDTVKKLSPFAAAYMKSKCRAARSNLQRDTFLLAAALSHARDPQTLRSMVLIDYAGGVGDLSLLAKELGIGTVIYNDISDELAKDARCLATAMNLVADHYVATDEIGLRTYLTSHDIVPDVLVSNDAIEHIYSIESFLDNIDQMSRGDFKLVLATVQIPAISACGERWRGFSGKWNMRGPSGARGRIRGTHHAPICR